MMNRTASYIPVCSAGGKIEKVLLFHTCSTSEKPETAWQRFGSLIDAMGEEVQFYVVMQLPNSYAIERLQSGRQNVHLVPLCPSTLKLEHPLTRWTQDVVHAFQRSSGPTQELQLVYDQLRLDTEVMRLLGSRLSTMRYRSLGFQAFSGGNLLPRSNGQNFLVAGGDILRHHIKGRPRNEHSAARAALEAQLRRTYRTSKVHWLNLRSEHGTIDGKQPLFHVDLYITLAGVLPDLHPNRETVLVGELRDEYIFGGNPEVAQRLRTALDRTAEWFENDRRHPGLKCVVKRIPLLLFDTQPDHMGSYNNCLVENYQGVSAIYLPDYIPEQKESQLARRIRQIQNKTRDELNSWGFSKVHFIEQDFYNLSRKQGSLHCLAKVIERNTINVN